MVGRAVGKGQREYFQKVVWGLVMSEVGIWKVMALHHLVAQFQLWYHVKRATCTHHYT